MFAALELRDERVGRTRALGDLMLGELQLVAPLPDVRRDPVPLAQRADRRVLAAGLSVLFASLGSGLGSSGRPLGTVRVAIEDRLGCSPRRIGGQLASSGSVDAISESAVFSVPVGRDARPGRRRRRRSMARARRSPPVGCPGPAASHGDHDPRPPLCPPNSERATDSSTPRSGQSGDVCDQR